MIEKDRRKCLDFIQNCILKVADIKTSSFIVAAMMKLVAVVFFLISWSWNSSCFCRYQSRAGWRYPSSSSSSDDPQQLHNLDLQHNSEESRSHILLRSRKDSWTMLRRKYLTIVMKYSTLLLTWVEECACPQWRQVCLVVVAAVDYTSVRWRMGLAPPTIQIFLCIKFDEIISCVFPPEVEPHN